MTVLLLSVLVLLEAGFMIFELTRKSSKKEWTTTPPDNSSVELTLSATVPGEGTSTTSVAVNTLNVTPETVTLDGSETTPWEYEWADLPQYYNGKKITYTVTETKVTIGGTIVWNSSDQNAGPNLYLTGTVDAEATETTPRTITFTNDFTFSIELSETFTSVMLVSSEFYIQKQSPKRNITQG